MTKRIIGSEYQTDDDAVSPAPKPKPKPKPKPGPGDHYPTHFPTAYPTPQPTSEPTPGSTNLGDNVALASYFGLENATPAEDGLVIVSVIALAAIVAFVVIRKVVSPPSSDHTPLADCSERASPVSSVEMAEEAPPQRQVMMEDLVKLAQLEDENLSSAMKSAHYKL